MGSSERPQARSLALTSFLAGLTQPSVLAAGVALATVAALFVAYCLVFGSWFVASPLYRYLMTDDLDTYTNVTHEVLDRQGDTAPGIVVLGTSVPVRCVAGETALTALVAAGTGRQIRTHDLATDAQTTWEMLALVDRLPPREGGVLVLGLTTGLMDYGTGTGQRSSLQGLIDAPRLGIVSPALDAAARQAGLKVPRRTGVYALDNAEFILSRRKELVKNLIRGGKTYGEPLSADWYAHVNRPEFWQTEIADLPKAEARYAQNAAANFAALEKVVALARAGGTESVVVLVSPVNPGWNAVPEAAGFLARYRADVAAFAARVDATVVQATEDAGLKQSDFVDYEGHLGNAAARDRCMAALARGIGNAIRGQT